MVNIVLCLLALIAASQTLPYDLTPRIVNGQEAKEGEFPYQISIQEKPLNLHTCGGSILNENYVLTAAHCVTLYRSNDIIVIAGVLDNNLKNYTHEVEKIITHQRYDPKDSYINDIALIKVKKPFEKVPTIKNVLLPSKDEPINEGDKVVVSGWGALSENGPSTNILRRVDIFIANQTYCKDMYKKTGSMIYKNQLCAYDPKIPKGSCYGDSGGPLSFHGKIIGIVSLAKACALTDYPTVYTRVSSYLDWIREHAV